METDEAILEQKALGSLERYGHELVIGNLLQSHKDKVVFYFADKERKPVVIERTNQEITDNKEIEIRMIEEIEKEHNKFISNNSN